VDDIFGLIVLLFGWIVLDIFTVMVTVTFGLMALVLPGVGFKLILGLIEWVGLGETEIAFELGLELGESAKLGLTMRIAAVLLLLPLMGEKIMSVYRPL
jgi:hypothetical protein